jgi:hypothetical protein
LGACRCGTHDKFIACEYVDDIFFDMMDEIVSVRFACWRKLRTLGHNGKHNRMSEKLASLKFFVNVPEQGEVEEDNTF